MNIQIAYQLIHGDGRRGKRKDLLGKVHTPLSDHCLSRLQQDVPEVSDGELTYCAYACLYQQAPLHREATKLREQIYQILESFDITKDFTQGLNITVLINGAGFEAIELTDPTLQATRQFSLLPVQDVFGCIFLFVTTVLGAVYRAVSTPYSAQVTDLIRNCHLEYAGRHLS
jgi:hypothetical protein